MTQPTMIDLFKTTLRNVTLDLVDTGPTDAELEALARRNKLRQRRIALEERLEVKLPSPCVVKRKAGWSYNWSALMPLYIQHCLSISFVECWMKDPSAHRVVVTFLDVEGDMSHTTEYMEDHEKTSHAMQVCILEALVAKLLDLK